MGSGWSTHRLPDLRVAARAVVGEAVAALHRALGLLGAGPGGDDVGVKAAVVGGLDERPAGPGEVLAQPLAGVEVAGGAEVVAGVAGARAARDPGVKADEVDGGGSHAAAEAQLEPSLSPSAAEGNPSGLTATATAPDCAECEPPQAVSLAREEPETACQLRAAAAARA